MAENRVEGYRRVGEEEKLAAMAVIGLAFGNPAQARDWAAQLDAEQLRVLDVDGEPASVLRLGLLPQYWLGRPVPSAQVLSLATSPEHGGRGHGLTLLKGLMAELHERGLPTVTLQPSTARFYRSAGFEFAKETANFLVESPNGPVGWVMLAFGEDPVPSHQSFALRLRVQDWGWLPGHDLAPAGALSGYRTLEGLVRWSGPDPDPLLFLLPNESSRLVRRSYWMLRLVDLAEAFGARPYPPEVAGRVVLRVEDPLCPWNSGTWTLEVEAGEGRLRRGDATSGLGGGATSGSGAGATRLRGLAALFTGFAAPDQLARVGLLDGVDGPGLELLRRAFASPPPFTAEQY
jgi:predicted acetyltransferase